MEAEPEGMLAATVQFQSCSAYLRFFFYDCNGLANLKSIAMKYGLALSLTHKDRNQVTKPLQVTLVKPREGLVLDLTMSDDQT